MSARHPIVVVTGSSGAGTTTVKRVFDKIFRRERVRATMIEGDAFHRYTRAEMKARIAAGDQEGRPVSHFGPDANEWPALQQQFDAYGRVGRCKTRLYLHSAAQAAAHGQQADTFTPWIDTPPDTDLLLYEGLHGCVRHDDVDLVRLADLKLGVVPIINLEWIQTLQRGGDGTVGRAARAGAGASTQEVSAAILRRMHDYVNHVVPQFGDTDINFQRVPVVDTSNPFAARDIPTAGESVSVIRFKNPRGIDFAYLLSMIDNAFMSRPNTIVVPGGKLDLAMQIILTPMIQRLMEIRRAQQ